MRLGYAVSLLTGIAIGGGIGYFVTKKMLEEKYQQIADTEIASVKARYSRQKPLVVKINAGADETDAELFKDVEDTIANEGYAEVPQDDYGTGKIPDDVMLITPEDFTDPEYDEYDKVTYYYFVDDVLSDGVVEVDPIYNGLDEAISSIGKYEVGAIHVRIPSQHRDIEILNDSLGRTFAEYMVDEGYFIKEPNE